MHTHVCVQGLGQERSMMAGVVDEDETGSLEGRDTHPVALEGSRGHGP